MSTGQGNKLDKETQKEVLKLLKKYCKGTGLKPEVMLAQMQLESGNFTSGLATSNFNFSGHKTIKSSLKNKTEGVDYTVNYTNEHFETEEKAKAYKKKNEKDGYKVENITQSSGPNGEDIWVVRLGQPFNKYTSLDDGVRNHIDFLTGDGKLTGKKFTAHKERYKDIREAKTAKDQIQALHDSPYATDAHYADSLNNVLNTNIYPTFEEFQDDSTALSASINTSVDATFDKYDKHVKNLKNPETSLNDYDHKVKYDLSQEMFLVPTTRLNPSEKKELLAELHSRDKIEGERLEQYVEEKRQKTKEFLKGKSPEEVTDFLNREEEGITQVYVNLNPGGRDTRRKGPYNKLDKNDRILGFDETIARRQKTEETLDAIIENKDGKFSVDEVNQATDYRDSLIRGKTEGSEVFTTELENKELFQDYGPADSSVTRTREPYTGYKKTTEEANQFFENSDVFKKLDETYKVTTEGEVVDAVEEETADPKGFTGPDGEFYPYQTVEAGEEDTITTEGLIEPLDTEVTLKGEPGVGKTLTPLEEYEQEQLKKQQRREKIANLAQGLGDGIKAAGVALMAGAGLKSMHEATKEHKINKIRVSPLMEEAFQKAKAMSTQGLTYAERAAAMADLNNAYAGAMKNVMAVSGGQRSTALANMGVVDASRVNALVDLAGKDAALRQGNMKMYQEQAVNYGKMQLSADSTNEQLRATLEEGRKNRLTKIGSSLFSEATEFSRNLADQKNNKELLDQFANVKNQLAVSTKETSHIMEMLEKANLGVDLGQ